MKYIFTCSFHNGISRVKVYYNKSGKLNYMRTITAITIIM